MTYILITANENQDLYVTLSSPRRCLNISQDIDNQNTFACKCSNDLAFNWDWDYNPRLKAELSSFSKDLYSNRINDINLELIEGNFYVSTVLSDN